MNQRAFRGAALLLCLAMGCANKKEEGAVLATVSGHAITAEDFWRELGGGALGAEKYLQSLSGRKELLELMVRRKVVLAEATVAGTAQRPAVEEKLRALDKQFQRQYKESRERLLIGEYFRSLKENDLKVSEEDLRKAWEDGKEARVSHILVDDPAVADSLRQRLAKGDSFSTLAKKYSTDEVTGRLGGDLGYVLPGTFDPRFEEALFGLTVGQVSGVVETPYGLHLIKKTDERPLSGRPLKEVETQLRQAMESQRFQAWIEKARARHRVTTNEPALNDLQAVTPSGMAPSPLPNEQLKAVKN